jgi:hypothetical protein
MTLSQSQRKFSRAQRTIGQAGQLNGLDPDDPGSGRDTGTPI